jgi:hypothetical protein
MAECCRNERWGRMTDREEAGLRGRIENSCTERAYIYPDHHWVMHTHDTFSLQGQLLERRHRNPEGSHWSIICRYDEQGQILEKEEVSKDPEANQLFSYKYDQLGRLDRVILRSAQEGERVFESVRYAADGTKTRTSYPTPLDDTKRKTTSVAAESMLHLSLDTVVIMTVLDASDRPIRKVLYDVDDRVIRRIAFRYDGRGLLLEEGELVGGSIRDDFRNVYRYDASGRQIEVNRRWGDLGGSRRTFAYNDRGDVVQEIIEQEIGFMGADTESQTWTERFAHQYDEHENWIERTAETIVRTGDARLSMIERRQLTYY